MKINIPIEAKQIIKTLNENNYKGYVVGGCVRDSLLGKEPKDWDITTNCSPEEVINIFKNTHKVIPTGLKHGTVTLLGVDNEPYEVTTFRKEGDYTDNRRPDNVEFVNDLYEDVRRRDFTINAMAYNEEEGLVDYFDGHKDIENKLIDCVGNADERFNEDALRMLRAVRFSSRLNFEIDKNTEKAIIKNHALIKNISMERIREEFNQIIITNPFKIHTLYEYKILNAFMPEYEICEKTTQNNPYHVYNVGEHIIHSMNHIEKEIHLRLAMLMHDICKPQCKTTDEKGIDHFYMHAKFSKEKAEEILKRMKYDNKTIERVCILVQYHDTPIIGKKGIRKMLNKIGKENFKDLLKVKIADMKAQNPMNLETRYNEILEIEDKFKEIIENKQCFTLKDLAIGGNDLMNLGYVQGKDVGITLNSLLEKVIEDPNLNTYENLMKIVKKSSI